MSDPQTSEMSVLFADVAGSTAIMRKLGDTEGRAVLIEVIGVMREVVAEHQGVVIDQIGDELMCTFPSAERALVASLRLHTRLLKEPVRGERLRVRIGFHHGDVIHDGDRIYGDAVHTSRRLASAAKADQVLISGSTLATLADDLMSPVRLVTMLRMKGHEQAVAVHEVVWNPKQATVITNSGILTENAEDELLLHHDGHTWLLSPSRVEVSIGRDEDREIQIDVGGVSRRHARIEMRDRSFVLIDESTNGTRLQPDGGEEIFVRRGEAHLTGTGAIVLHDTDPPHPMLVIRYAITGEPEREAPPPAPEPTGKVKGRLLRWFRRGGDDG